MFRRFLLIVLILLFIPSLNSAGTNLVDPVEMKRIQISEMTITNQTTWDGLDIALMDKIVVENGGNLTIINSRIDFNNNDSIEIIIENGGTVLIRNSELFNGEKAITGNSNGMLLIKESVLHSFLGDIIKLEGEYDVQLIDSNLNNGAKDGLQMSSRQDQINRLEIINTKILNFGKDGLNLENTFFFADNIVIDTLGDEGIQFDGPIGNFTILNSEIRKATSDGVKLRSYNQTAIIRNVTISENKDDGFQITKGPADVYISESTFTQNSENGLEIDTANLVEIANSNISDNLIRGIEARDGGSLTVLNSFITKNREDGVFVQNQQKVNLNGSTINQNSVNGITVSSSSLLLFESDVSLNGEDGVHVGDNSISLVLNNTISNNLENGLFYSNTSTGLINFNSITNNVQFGLFVETSTNANFTINANNNYWGSDSGPIINNIESETTIENSISGPITIDFVLTDEGLSVPFVPPVDSETDFERLLQITLILVVLLIIAGITGLIFLRWRWIRTTQPILIVINTHTGLPIAEIAFSEIKQDTVLLAGFLTAINSFGGEILDHAKDVGSKISLQEINYDRFTILLRLDADFLTAMVVLKSNPLIRRSLDAHVINSLGDIRKVYDRESLQINIPHESLEKYIEQVKIDFQRYTTKPIKI